MKTFIRKDSTEIRSGIVTMNSMNGVVEVDVDGFSFVCITIDEQWLDAPDLRFLAKQLTRMATALEVHAGDE